MLAELEEDINLSLVDIENMYNISNIKQIKHGQMCRLTTIFTEVPVLFKFCIAFISQTVLVLNEGKLVSTISYLVHPVTINFSLLAATIIDWLYSALDIYRFNNRTFGGIGFSILHFFDSTEELF